MKRTLFLGAALLTAISTLAAGRGYLHGAPVPNAGSPKREASSKRITLNLDKAVAAHIPELKAALHPAVFTTPDGRSGWALKYPGDRPIATPAYADGLLFVGGGYGSHEFYAFDAATGKTAWKIATKDDGPTAAVVEDGCVAFNTESCTICVVEEKTGKTIWQEWLGDPLMSQPAISKGRLYIAYPAGQRGGHAQQAAPSNSSQARGVAGYRLLCADLHTGKHIWETPITTDVISAPVIEGDRVLITCMDGTSFSLDALTGSVVWKKQNAGTSAPIVANGQVVMTLKAMRAGRSYEGVARLDSKGDSRAGALLAPGEATYFMSGKEGSVPLGMAAQKSLDSGVGFGGGAPASAGMDKVAKHLNFKSVAGGWAYQGSRVAVGGGRLMNAQANMLNSVGAKDGKVAWRAEAKGAGITGESQLFSPPALGRKNLYLCTAQGHLLSVNQADGRVGFLYATKQPMAFQPALANGSLFAGTANGLLICLKTGDKDATGWTAWGGNAQHNKKN